MCGNAPSAPQLPQYPDLTGAEQTNLGQQAGAAQQGSQMLNTVSGQLGQNTNILQMISGLFNPDGSVNQNALTQLQQTAKQATTTAGTAGQSALAGLGGTQSAIGATSNAYQNALQGNVPQNQQLQFTQNQNFQAMKEQAAQQGIQINGDNWGNATSNSTSGQKLLQNMQQNNNIQNNQYALGYTQQLAGNMGQLAGAYGTQANSAMGLSGYAQQTPLGYVGQSITGGQSMLSPLLSNYQNQLSSAYQPLYMQQIGPYQQQMAQAQANYQGAVGQYNSREGQLGAELGIAMPAASAFGFGVNPTSGFGGLSKGVGSSGGATASAGDANVLGFLMFTKGV